MPTANTFLYAAIIGYSVFLLSMIFIVRIILRLPIFYTYKYARLSLITLTCIANVPFVYWLFLYKGLPINIDSHYWNLSWLASIFIVIFLYTLSIISLIILKPTKNIVVEHKAQDEQSITTRREFIATGLSVGISFIVTKSLDDSNDVHNVEITNNELWFSNIPDSFDRFRIAVLSDIHSSPFMEKKDIKYLVQTVNSLKADVIVLPGDFINNQKREIYPCVEALSDLRAPMGCYAITGNHDYFDSSINVVCNELEQIGIKVMRNQSFNLEKGNQSIIMLGLDDPYLNSVGKYLLDGFTHEKELESMIIGVDFDNDFTLMLGHRPYRFDEYAQLGVDCMIAGHTHGGQIVLADFGSTNLSFPAISTPYVKGKYQSKVSEAQLYVTRGVGSVGIPIRINCPPEIALLTLRKK